MKMELNRNGEQLNLVFARKVCTLEEMEADIAYYATQGAAHLEPVTIVAEKKMSAAEWRAFANDILECRDWLAAFSEAAMEAHLYGERRPCIKVWAEGVDKAIIINTEGYDYPRYTSVIPA